MIQLNKELSYPISETLFVFALEYDYIKMAIYGSNEKPNQNTDMISSLKNMFIALGRRVGLSKIKWKHFTDGIVNLK